MLIRCIFVLFLTIPISSIFLRFLIIIIRSIFILAPSIDIGDILILSLFFVFSHSFIMFITGAVSVASLFRRQVSDVKPLTAMMAILRGSEILCLV